MKTFGWRRLVLVAGAATLALGAIAGWSGVNSERQQSQLLDGRLWRELSPDARVAFVWGVGNLVEYERAQHGPGSGGERSFMPFLVQGLRGKPINEIVRRVDAYYAAHEAELERPVIDAIFQAVVLPELRADKDGRKSR